MLKKLTISAAALTTSVAVSNAALSLTNISGDLWEVSLDPISFVATGSSTGDLDWLVFDGFFDADSTVQGAYDSGTLDFSIDGGAVVSVTPRATNDNGTFDRTLGGINADDLLLNVAGSVGRPVTTAGQTVAVSGTIRFISSDVPSFSSNGTVSAAFYNNNPAAAELTTNQITVTVVPEPSSVALLGLGGLALILRRKK